MTGWRTRLHLEPQARAGFLPDQIRLLASQISQWARWGPINGRSGCRENEESFLKRRFDRSLLNAVRA